MKKHLEDFLAQIRSVQGKIERDESLNRTEVEALAKIRRAIGLRKSVPKQSRLAPLLPLWLPWVAAAALAVFAAILWVRASSRDQLPIGVAVRHVPKPVRGGAAQRPRIDGIELATSEATSVVVVLRTWNAQKNALEWQLYRWKDGSLVVSLAPDQPAEIPIDVTADPPVTQFAVMAASRDPAALRKAVEDGNALLEGIQKNHRALGG